MTELLLWGLAALGVTNIGLLGRTLHQIRQPRPPAQLRPCSCGHGLGRHDENGCGYRTSNYVQVGKKPIRDANGNPVYTEYGRVQYEDVYEEKKLVCGCKQFDGEIPSDMVGREFLGLPPGIGGGA